MSHPAFLPFAVFVNILPSQVSQLFSLSKLEFLVVAIFSIKRNMIFYIEVNISNQNRLFKLMPLFSD